jgi:4-hydroxybenzoate-CoA ligase
MANLAAITERRPYNAASDFVDANVNAGRGNKVAFKEGNRTLTYGDLQKESCRFASGLASLGFGHESRMVMLATDTIGISGRVLGCDPRRGRTDPAEYAA